MFLQIYLNLIFHFEKKILQKRDQVKDMFIPYTNIWNFLFIQILFIHNKQSYPGFDRNHFPFA